MVIYMAMIMIIYSNIRYLGGGVRSSFFVIQSPSKPHHNHPHCLHLEKNIYIKIEGENSHAAQCSKPIELFKLLKEIFDIDSFEHQIIIIKGLLYPEKLKKKRLTLVLTNH